VTGIGMAAASGGNIVFPPLTNNLYWDGPYTYSVNGGFVRLSDLSNGFTNKIRGNILGGSGSSTSSVSVTNIQKFGGTSQTIFPSTPAGGGITASTNNQLVGDRIICDYHVDATDNVTGETTSFVFTLEVDRTS